MAKANLTNGFPRTRWFQLLAVMAVAFLLLAIPIGGVYMIRDRGRSRAIAVYESLRPQMQIEEVRRILDRAGVRLWVQSKQYSCVIDKRFDLFLTFDQNKRLDSALILEKQTDTQIPDFILALMNQLGYPIGPVMNGWP